MDKYHTWLRTLPIQGEANSTVNLEGKGKDGVTLYERLCMMETSVVMQSQELKRTKQLFLRDKALLQVRHLPSVAAPRYRAAPSHVASRRVAKHCVTPPPRAAPSLSTPQPERCTRGVCFRGLAPLTNCPPNRSGSWKR